MLSRSKDLECSRTFWAMKGKQQPWWDPQGPAEGRAVCFPSKRQSGDTAERRWGGLGPSTAHTLEVSCLHNSVATSRVSGCLCGLCLGLQRLCVHSALKANAQLQGPCFLPPHPHRFLSPVPSRKRGREGGCAAPSVSSLCSRDKALALLKWHHRPQWTAGPAVLAVGSRNTCVCPQLVPGKSRLHPENGSQAYCLCSPLNRGRCRCGPGIAEPSRHSTWLQRRQIRATRQRDADSCPAVPRPPQR